MSDYDSDDDIRRTYRDFQMPIDDGCQHPAEDLKDHDVKDQDLGEQLAILNSIKERKHRVLRLPTYTPVQDYHTYEYKQTTVHETYRSRVPPPTPPRPRLSNETRIMIADERRQAMIQRQSSVAMQLRSPQSRSNSHNLMSRDEYKHTLEQVLHRSITDYEQPFRGLQNKEKRMIERFSKHVDTNVVKAKRECIICLDAFKLGDKRTLLPCTHDFHFNCINKWLETNNTCPICKNNVSNSLKPYVDAL
jgi:hypothetical protein